MTDEEPKGALCGKPVYFALPTPRQPIGYISDAPAVPSGLGKLPCTEPAGHPGPCNADRRLLLLPCPLCRRTRPPRADEEVKTSRCNLECGYPLPATDDARDPKHTRH
jgi:hypothetical protein